MNNDQLEALIIDHGFGELSDEVSSLLEAYLATHPEAQKEAEKIRTAMDITQQTVVHSPEIFRAPTHTGTDFLGHLAVFLTYLKTRNAAFAMAVIFSGMAGFFLKGNFSSQSPSPAPVASESRPLEKNSNTGNSIWAKYRIDDGGRPVLLLAATPSQAK